MIMKNLHKLTLLALLLISLFLMTPTVHAQRGAGGPDNPGNKNLPIAVQKFKQDLLVKEIQHADLIVLGKVLDNKPNPNNTVARRQALQQITLTVSDVLKGDKKTVKGVVVNVPVSPYLKSIVEAKKGTPNVYILTSDGPETGSYHIKFPEDVVAVNQAEVIRALARN